MVFRFVLTNESTGLICFRLVLTNDSGECETSADGVVLGRPSRPTGPIEVIICVKFVIHEKNLIIHSFHVVSSHPVNEEP